MPFYLSHEPEVTRLSPDGLDADQISIVKRLYLRTRRECRAFSASNAYGRARATEVWNAYVKVCQMRRAS